MVQKQKEAAAVQKQKEAAAVQAESSPSAGSSSEGAGPSVPSSHPEASSQPEASSHPDTCFTTSGDAQAEPSGLQEDNLPQSVGSTPKSSGSPELDAIPNGNSEEGPEAVTTSASELDSTSPIVSDVQENGTVARGSKKPVSNFALAMAYGCTRQRYVQHMTFHLQLNIYHLHACR